MAGMKRGENIYLVGLMGAGKTTVGRLLARRLKLRFVDSDQEIERRCGVKIPLIWEIEGEAGFRGREAQVLAELTAQEGAVLATGGGAVLLDENRRRLAARARWSISGQARGTVPARATTTANRPLLATGDPLARLRELYAERDSLYRGVADLVIDTGARACRRWRASCWKSWKGNGKPPRSARRALLSDSHRCGFAGCFRVVSPPPGGRQRGGDYQRGRRSALPQENLKSA